MPYIENYNTDPVVAYAGMVADEEVPVVISRTVETAAGIAFGLPVQQGANDNGCVAIAAGATEVLGFTIRDQARDALNPDLYSQYEGASLLRQGVMWVTVVDAGGVVPGDPVWVKLADGSLSNADVGSSGGLKLPGCRWETTAANGALAKVRINLAVPAVAGA